MRIQVDPNDLACASRFITITGVGPGVGKTTLASTLVSDFVPTRLLLEDDTVFGFDEFAEVATWFRRRSSPPPVVLEAAYDAVAAPVAAAGTLLADWSVIDLAEDLDWAEASEPALHEHVRRVYELFRPMAPVIVYLDCDPMVGLRRREAQHGRPWFARQADNLGLADAAWTDRVQAMAHLYARRRERVLRAMAAGGWPVITVDASREADAVLAAARAVLTTWSPHA